MQNDSPISPDIFESPKLMSPSQHLLSEEQAQDKQVNAIPPPAYTGPSTEEKQTEKDYTALFVNILQGEAAQVTRDTLDEPVMDTIKRDLSGISAKLQTVLSAGQADTDADMTLREWDMWGPLLFSLLLAVYHHQLRYVVNL